METEASLFGIASSVSNGNNYQFWVVHKEQHFK